MSRADVPADQRAPFYLYVDEFQNFATDSFATILSEARKYGLNLTVANQYIAQMMQTVRDAVFGNVGSIISFRMSADDSNAMTRYFEPRFTSNDLVHTNNRHFVVSMTIDGEKTPAFSAISLNLPPYGEDYSQSIIDYSRSRYSSTREYVEKYVGERYLDPTKQEQEKSLPADTKKVLPSKEKKKPESAVRKPVKQSFSPISIGKTATEHEAAEVPRQTVVQAAADEEQTPKKKRKRTRKRKKSTAVEQAITEDMKMLENGKTIKL